MGFQFKTIKTCISGKKKMYDKRKLIMEEHWRVKILVERKSCPIPLIIPPFL